MIEILIIIGVVLGVLIFSSCVVMYSSTSLKEIKKVYKLLPTYKYYLSNGLVYTYQLGETPTRFIWFLDDNTFCINGYQYLHNQFYTFLSPVHCYWYIKYRLWFKKNVDPETIEPF